MLPKFLNSKLNIPTCVAFLKSLISLLLLWKFSNIIHDLAARKYDWTVTCTRQLLTKYNTHNAPSLTSSAVIFVPAADWRPDVTELSTIVGMQRLITEEEKNYASLIH